MHINSLSCITSLLNAFLLNVKSMRNHEKDFIEEVKIKYTHKLYASVKMLCEKNSYI